MGSTLYASFDIESDEEDGLGVFINVRLARNPVELAREPMSSLTPLFKGLKFVDTSDTISYPRINLVRHGDGLPSEDIYDAADALADRWSNGVTLGDLMDLAEMWPYRSFDRFTIVELYVQVDPRKMLLE